MQNPPFIILILILANVLISYKGFKEPLFFNRFKFQIAGIKNGERIRILSSGFLHVDWTHLFFNMFTLYYFAQPVLNVLGIERFLLIYFGSLIAGNLSAYFFFKNEPYYSAVGASGAVSGILFSAILLYPDMTLMFIFLPIPIPAYLFVVGYIVYTLYGMKKQNDTIGHTTHLGGAVGGVVITIVTAPYLIVESLGMLGIVVGTLTIAGYLLFRQGRH